MYDFLRVILQSWSNWFWHEVSASYASLQHRVAWNDLTNIHPQRLLMPCRSDIMDIVSQNHSTWCTCSYCMVHCVGGPSLWQGVCTGAKASMPMFLLCGLLSSTSSFYSYDNFWRKMLHCMLFPTPTPTHMNAHMHTYVWGAFLIVTVHSILCSRRLYCTW